MIKLLIVGSGGFVGAVLRYLISGWVQQWSGNAAFPYGTLAVNMIGCFVIGVVYQLVEMQAGIPSEIRLLVLVGILGAFTTYSTFSNETFNLFHDHPMVLGLLNIGVHVVVGLLAVLLGRWVATLIR
jgi:CrcB protein